jgi:hypothetical protein
VLGEALYARVRQTLEPLCYAYESLVACRRDLSEDSRQVGLPLPPVDRVGQTVDFMPMTIAEGAAEMIIAAVKKRSMRVMKS